MNFSKIKTICEEKGLTIPGLADKIGLSEAGLYQSIRNQSMKVDVLEKIAEVLETPIWIFFDLDPGSQIEALNKEIFGYKEMIETIKANMPAIKKELVDMKEKLDMSANVIEAQAKLIENYEKMQFYSEEIKKSEKVVPMIWESIKIIKGVVSGKIKIGSPEAKKLLDFKPEDYPLPRKFKKSEK
jgi:transcriptional regulator with XRE-family HTH domain